jgi:tetratricopeptide (TPR) repeat protein
MGVGADGISAPSGIEARRPQIARRLEAHHVGRSKKPAAPEAGELALGPRGFKEYAGHFWGFLETRPYMRARAGLAGTLQQLGDVDAALAHYRDMLKLNPNDNQRIRYVLAGALLRQDDYSALKDLLAAHEDGSAFWLYTQALLAFRESTKRATTSPNAAPLGIVRPARSPG